jgi:hypothetical protein
MKAVKSELGGEITQKRQLELAFVDKNGKAHSLEQVTQEELAEGLARISKEVAKRLSLQKEQR